MQKIALAGVKHTGKSTKGRLLAEAHKGTFKDLDDLILELLPEGYTIRSWYREKGQQAFKEREVAALKEYLDHDKNGFSCLALGGATLENREARNLLLEAPLILCGIDDEEEILFQRIKRKGLPPFLETDNPEQTFHEMYETRNATIREYCDIVISCRGLSLEEAVNTLNREILNYSRSLEDTGE